MFFFNYKNYSTSACHGSKYIAIDPLLNYDWLIYLDDSFITFNNGHIPCEIMFPVWIYESFARIFDIDIDMPPPNLLIYAVYDIVL